MDEFSFEWRGTGSLLSTLKSPIWGISLSHVSSEEIHAVKLWHGEFFGLELHSKMHDVGDRDEVGILQFTHSFGGSINTHPQVYRFNPPIEVDQAYSLQIEDPSVGIIDSGIMLSLRDGSSIVIVPGALPCSLAMTGGADLLAKFDPEYPLDQYVKSKIGV